MADSMKVFILLVLAALNQAESANVVCIFNKQDSRYLHIRKLCKPRWQPSP